MQIWGLAPDLQDTLLAAPSIQSYITVFYTTHPFYGTSVNMEKDFEGWHKLKVALDGYALSPTFQEREIWWCSIGMNIGYEMYGKSSIFTRPVLVLRKFSHYTFLGVPLSTKIKDNPYYYRFAFKGAEACAVLDQLKTFDSRRLAGKMGKISEKQLETIKQAYIALL